MAFAKEDSINFVKLEKELERAVQADAKYERENAAKFRAVEQRVPTYEMFRDIVAASHLKPLEKGERLVDDDFKQKWNAHASGTGVGSTDAQTPSEHPSDIQTSESIEIPRDSAVFTKQWKNLSTEQRTTLVSHLTTDNVRTLFRSEIPGSLLPQLCTALTQALSDASMTSGAVCDVLMTLTEARRFELTVDFLSKQEQRDVHTCVGALRGRVDDQCYAKLGQLYRCVT